MLVCVDNDGFFTDSALEAKLTFVLRASFFTAGLLRFTVFFLVTANLLPPLVDNIVLDNCTVAFREVVLGGANLLPVIAEELERLKEDLGNTACDRRSLA